jgi:hypothetical protein
LQSSSWLQLGVHGRANVERSIRAPNSDLINSSSKREKGAALKSNLKVGITLQIKHIVSSTISLMHLHAIQKEPNGRRIFHKSNVMPAIY